MEPTQKQSFSSECNSLGSKAFAILELVEVSGVSPESFRLIRKKLLNLGNDIKRIPETYNPHVGCFCSHCNPKAGE
jgi:hypothetical protein